MAETLRHDLEAALTGAYAIERKLGGGGMSRVFLATEKALQRRVVIKVLAPELARGVSADRFRLEIQVAASLQHPHIVPLLAAGEARAYRHYLALRCEAEPALQPEVRRLHAEPQALQASP